MLTHNAFLKNRGIPTTILISHQQLIPEYNFWYQINTMPDVRIYKLSHLHIREY